jgi:hypothetical protein
VAPLARWAGGYKWRRWWDLAIYASTQKRRTSPQSGGQGRRFRADRQTGDRACDRRANCIRINLTHSLSASVSGEQEKSRSSTGSTDNTTASRGRGNSEVEQQLENEPTRDAEKMEQSRTTRME